jgi:type II secretory pathway predicted ATPase ExeA
MLDFIAQRRYFVLHAPRQTGKTTCLRALCKYLNAQGDYASLYINIEGAQAARNDIAGAAQVLVGQLATQAVLVLKHDVINLNREALMAKGAYEAFSNALRLLSETLPKPLVLFIDEVDSLVGDTLISLLRQIRSGYTDRPAHFPQTVILCGVRDVRDYRMTMADGEVITGGSAFNIKAESLRLGDFSRAEMTTLYQQHTDATGQKFSDEALELAWTSTQGQPWLVNALAEQAVWKTKENLDRTVEIDLQRMRDAREALILRNDTHLDQLAAKLNEPRVRAVIEPMLMGERASAHEDDEQYVIDLGLIRKDIVTKSILPANAIYAEILPRVLSKIAQSSLHTDDIRSSWKDSNGKLNPRQFLLNFLDFWREHGESMMHSVPYHEAAPHLVLMAYLQRVINGGGRSSALSSHASCAAERAHMDVRTGQAGAGCVGRIEREYAAGSGRLDLLVIVDNQHMAIEVKVWRTGRKNPLIDGLQQMQRYLQRLNLDQGYLVIFDQRNDAAIWGERMHIDEAQTADGKAVMVLRG